ncbi:MAG: UvrB/UvrC motif-containing protein [Planctomycetota bacterium]
MTDDIDPILESWKSPGGARRIIGADGGEKVQLRVEANGHRGVVQFDCDGRPDGKLPHGCDFALDHYVARFEHDVQSGAPPEGFRLSHEEAAELIEEAVLVYNRYVILLQLEDYDRVVRDTERNMRLFRFLHRHAEAPEDADALEKWWPYIIRIHQTAKAFAAAGREDYEGALAAAREAERELLALPEQDDPVFKVERERSVKAITEMEAVFGRRVPPDRVALLEEEKLRAVEREDYEHAARLRDEIERLRGELDKAD